ncbi:MAG: mechanosensitive ion channel family protein [Candidatus Micrarchaeota archaeon]
MITQLNAIDPVTVSIGFLVLSFIVATVVLTILKMITRQVAKRTKTDLDDKLLEAMQTPLFRIIIVFGLYLAVMNLELEGGIVDIALKLILTIAYLVTIGFVVKIINVLIMDGLSKFADKTDSTLDDEIIPIFHKTLVVVTWAFGVIMILGVWGVDVAPFLAGLGIAGLAVSFALQPTLSNVFSGVSLIIDKTFRVGDKIQLDSGEVGEVYEISLRSTRIKTYDNEIIVLPNDNLAKAKIKNYTQPDHRVRVVVNFGVEYGNDPSKVIKLIEGSIKNDVKGILDDPAVSVVFTEMASSSLNFSARFWVPNYQDAYDKKLEATSLIYNELNKAKIGIPFPTQTVHLKK